MDFFKELLESFSRVHDRSLRLLEAEAVDPNRFKAANAVLAAANISTANPNVTVDGFKDKGTVPSQIPVIFNPNTGSLSVNRSYVNWNEMNKTMYSKDSKLLKKVITMLIGSEEGGDTDKTKTEKVSQALPAGETARRGVFSDDDDGDQAREAVVAAFVNMGRILPEALEKAGLDPSKYERLFVGATNESFESKLSKSNKYLVKDEDSGFFKFEEGTLDNATVVGVARTMEDMLATLGRGAEACPPVYGDDDPTGPPKPVYEQTFMSNIKKTKRGEIVITPDGADISQSLVFTDDTRGRRKNLGTMKDVINKAFELCGKKIPVVDILGDVGEGGNSDNNTIGTGYELFQKLGVMSINIERMQAAKQAIPDALANEYKKTRIQFGEKMRKLSEITALNFTRQRGMGLTTTDTAYVNNLKDQFEPRKDKDGNPILLRDKDGNPIKDKNGNDILADDKPLLVKMLELSMTILKDRNPKFVTEAGSETKFGERQDIREYYSTSAEGMAALEKAGLDSSSFSMNTLEEMIEGGHMTDSEAEAAMAAGLVKNKKSQIAVIKTSLKFYKDINNVTLGGGSNNTYHQMMEEDLNAGGPYHKLINTMLDDLEKGKNKDGSTETSEDAWKAMQKYANGLKSIEDTIGGIPSKVDVITDSGTTKRLYVNSAQRFADIVEEELRNNNSYEELTTGTKKRIMSRIQLLKKSKANYTEDALYKTIQNEVSTMLIHAKVEKDLNSGDDDRVKNAQRWLASKAYHAGGSDDPKLNETAVSRETGDSHVYHRNKLLKKVVNGKGNWKVDMDKSKFEDGLVIYSNGKKTLTLSTNTVPTRSKEEGETVDERKSVNTRTTLTANGPTQSGEDKRTGIRKVNSSTILQALGSLHEALGLIKEKVRLLNT